MLTLKAFIRLREMPLCRIYFITYIFTEFAITVISAESKKIKGLESDIDCMTVCYRLLSNDLVGKSTNPLIKRSRREL